MPVSARFLDELRSRITLSEIIGRRVRLVRAGREFKACCPFHDEKTPSFYVNDDKQFYHCFGCGAHGDVIGFVMQHDNISFMDAVDSLASQAGLQVPKASREERESYDRQKNLYALMDEAARHMGRVLRGQEGRQAYEYLKGRGIGEETISAFRIGYACEDGQWLRKHLLAKGFTDDQMIEAGVVRSSKKGGKPYAFFRDRIMFPVPDRRGRIVAFGGRVLPEDLRPVMSGDYTPPKYMNSSDTALFDKGSMLYGEPHARQAAVDGQTLIVVEGYMDVIACSQAGFGGAVAPLGTSLTEEQIQVLWKLIPDDEKKPVICFDGDEAGRRAAARACERVLPLLRPGYTVLFSFLPEGEDPDTLIRSSGGKSFKAVIDNAMPLADYLWMHHASQRDLSTPEGRAGFGDALEKEVLRIADRSVQSFYRQEFRRRISEKFFSGRTTGKSHGPERIVRVHKPSYKVEDLHRKILLSTIINHPGILEFCEDEFMSLDFVDNELIEIQKNIVDIWNNNIGVDSAELKNTLYEKGFKEILDKVLSGSIYIHAGFARPESTGEKALEGWRHFIEMMHRNNLLREQKEAGAVLAVDTTEENESRMLAFYNMHKAGDAH